MCVRGGGEGEREGGGRERDKVEPNFSLVVN